MNRRITAFFGVAALTVVLPASAQADLLPPRPLRIGLGLSVHSSLKLLAGLTCDLATPTPGTTLSYYGEANAAIFDESITANGLSVRQSIRGGWAGIGIGTYIGKSGTDDRPHDRRTGTGVRFVVGSGSGLFFTEASVTVISGFTGLRPGVQFGIRL